MEGDLTLIFGPMYASKTTTMLGKLMSEAAIGLKVLYINHEIDSRSIEGVNSDLFSTHNLMYRKASESMEIKSKNITFVKVNRLPSLDEVEEYDSIGIDEYQFFDPSNNEVIIRYIDSGKIVFVCGLVSDVNRDKFGGLVDLIPHANNIIHLKAFCENCGKKGIRREAIYTSRISVSPSSDQVDVGAAEKYIPVCRLCYIAGSQLTKPQI